MPPSTTVSPASSPSSVEERQIRLERDSDNKVFIITFTGSPHKANVFTLPLLQRLDQLLDQVEANLPRALILRGTGSFFSAGFDLQALTGKSHNKSKNSSSETTIPQNKPPTTPMDKTPVGQDLVNYSWTVLARLLIFPAPTLAVFNGHAFGLGLFIGLACDHRIMLQPQNTTTDKNSDKKKKSGGYLCLPEITIGLPLGSGFAALAKCKMTPQTLRTSALTGKQWTAQEALQAGIVDAVVSAPTNDNALPKAVLDMAQQLVSTSEKGNLSKIKMELYHETHAVLTSPSSRRAKL